MKKFSLLALGLSIAMNINAGEVARRELEEQRTRFSGMEITMPSAEVLRKNIVNAGFEDFDKHSKFSTKLAGQTISPLLVEVFVAGTFGAYLNFNSKIVGKTAEEIQGIKNQKSAIVKAYLASFPSVDVLEMLKVWGVYNNF